MGGWFLQPDCLMPCGEGIVRQIREGEMYFREKFGVKPTTAVNFDPFGHSRGIVQIMAKCGQDGYMFMRPYGKYMPYPQLKLPAEYFIWEGYDGSRVKASRITEYNSDLGKATEKITAERRCGNRTYLLGRGKSRRRTFEKRSCRRGKTDERKRYKNRVFHTRNIFQRGEAHRSVCGFFGAVYGGVLYFDVFAQTKIPPSRTSVDVCRKNREYRFVKGKLCLSRRTSQRRYGRYVECAVSRYSARRYDPRRRRKRLYLYQPRIAHSE